MPPPLSDPQPTRARHVLLGFAITLAAILYLDRVCISQSQQLISDELGLDKKQMGLAMTMFGIAYALFEIPGGWLGDRIGARKVLTRVVAWWSIFTIATGWARGLWSLATIRFLFGAGEAGCFPNLTRAFSSWFRGGDRTRAQAVTWLAARWGGAFTPVVVVAVLEFATWRQSFFLFGSVGFVWAFFFWRWFRVSPAHHPGVNEAERTLLAGAVASVTAQESHAGVPWGRFFGSVSVWLLCVQYACLSYGFWFYLTWLPTYIKEQFHLEQAERYVAALLAAPPLFLAGVSCLLTGWLTPRLAHRCGGMARARRVLGVAGHALASLMLVVSISFQNPVLAMIAMGFSCFGNDMAMPGSWTGCMDLGGRFSGTLSGIMNTWGSIGGLLAPWTIPYILEAAGDNWTAVILTIAGCYFVGALCWLGIDPVTPLDESSQPHPVLPAK
jgi:ACS family glucarate transporter-like MFS transporter